ncbi:Ubiquitin-like domain superfamily [Sesbania bispinosa]|nr:Ubiquitin-like domain superfamily [Sesbania bispinosa]
MDVIFEVERGSTFSIEVGFFDTILEMKEKVQKYESIPISKQTLIFNGQVLPDDGDIWKCEIFQNSRIQLIVAPDSDKSPSTKIQLNVKITSSNVHIPLEMDLNDTVLKLKEKIHEIMENPVPVHRLILHLHATATELYDHQLLRDCHNISDNAEIDVSFRLPTTILRSGGNVGGSKKLKVMVLPYKDGAKKIPVEVNASDKVGELRKELENLNQRLEIHLPRDGRYFFIHKQSVMDDDRSFRSHHVGQGDTIDIFPGYVTDS